MFRRKKMGPVPSPDVVPRLTLAELRSILEQPNGRNLLLAQREWHVQFSKQQAIALAEQEQLVAFTRAMKDNAEGVVRDIDSLIGSLAA